MVKFKTFTDSTALNSEALDAFALSFFSSIPCVALALTPGTSTLPAMATTKYFPVALRKEVLTKSNQPSHIWFYIVWPYECVKNIPQNIY